MPSNRALTAALLFASSVLFLGCTPDSSASGGDGTGDQSTEVEANGSGSDPGGASEPGASATGGSASTTGTNAATTNGTDPVQACVSACEAKYPKGALIGKGIDQCWAKSCPSECNDIGAGQAVGPRSGSCQNPVSTPSASCSQCTVNRCCTAWDACFNDAQCAALNTCSIACYK
jgi:hypothetical protein